MALSFILMLSVMSVVYGSFSIYYKSMDGDAEIITPETDFRIPSHAEHIADLYRRVSGQDPILREEKVNLPTQDIFTAKVVRPTIIEVLGGSIPSSLKHLATSLSTQIVDSQLGERVVNVLHSHGVDVVHKTFNLDEEGLHQYISEQKQPIFVIYHENQRASRLLSSSNITVEVAGPTEAQISSYQITAFTGIVMVVLLTSAVCMISNMEVIPDSLLYAKFQSSRTHKND